MQLPHTQTDTVTPPAPQDHLLLVPLCSITCLSSSLFPLLSEAHSSDSAFGEVAASSSLCLASCTSRLFSFMSGCKGLCCCCVLFFFFTCDLSATPSLGPPPPSHHHRTPSLPFPSPFFSLALLSLSLSRHAATQELKLPLCVGSEGVVDRSGGGSAYNNAEQSGIQSGQALRSRCDATTNTSERSSSSSQWSSSPNPPFASLPTFVSSFPLTSLPSSRLVLCTVVFLF